MKSFLELDVRTGQFRTFLGDLDIPSAKEIKIERVSYILPANPVLRLMFKILREVFGDNGKIADWTRRWKCAWVVKIGSSKWSEFKDRQKALEFERAMITAKVMNEKE